MWKQTQTFMYEGKMAASEESSSTSEEITETESIVEVAADRQVSFVLTYGVILPRKRLKRKRCANYVIGSTHT